MVVKEDTIQIMPQYSGRNINEHWEDSVDLDVDPWNYALRVVPYKAPKTVRDVVQRYATYFRREFRYDFVQYNATEQYVLKQTRPFLIEDNVYSSGRYIGAGRFEWMNWKDAPHGWCLMWIWIHPYYRNRGVLSGLWPTFEAWCPNFYIDTPISPPMDGFLKKRGRSISPLVKEVKRRAK